MISLPLTRREQLTEVPLWVCVTAAPELAAAPRSSAKTAWVSSGVTVKAKLSPRFTEYSPEPGMISSVLLATV